MAWRGGGREPQQTAGNLSSSQPGPDPRPHSTAVVSEVVAPWTTGRLRLRSPLITRTAYPRVLDELVPSACHITEQYGNNPIESDHGRPKSRLRLMRGLKQLRCARVIPAGTPSSRTSAAATTNWEPSKQ